MPNIRQILSAKTTEIDAWLHAYFAKLGNTNGYPRALLLAAEYSLFSGGKRIRPALALLVNEAYGAEPARALPIAAALEMIHTYSCIHDDLPAMDNDDFRRGRPSCHRQYNEATAILAGDALLTEAFAALALVPDREYLPELVRLLAEAAGFQGMVAGQTADIAAEGGEAELAFIHAHKTGALLTASVLLPAIIHNPPASDLASIRKFGESLGLAFQIVDDILNETADAEILGKPTGTDREAGKLTWVTLHGLDRARQMAKTEIDNAKSAIEFLGTAGASLRLLADYVLLRDR
ncbi:MAG: polyprenyl synthetase family protein [Spirochaetota bacterium]|jgi:geranylgeranyl diphosphate synthase type II|nr:polyprenyl synthetase family protein [Spirochaetota bacterium]